MPLEILLERQININFNDDRIIDALESSLLVYSVEPIISQSSKQWSSYVPGFSTVEDVNEFYDIDQDGLYLTAHQQSKLKDGQVINRKALNFTIYQHIPQNRVQDIERLSQEGLSKLDSGKIFGFGYGYIENPTSLLIDLTSRLQKLPEDSNGYYLFLSGDKEDINIGVLPYDPSLIENAKVKFKDFSAKIRGFEFKT